MSETDRARPSAEMQTLSIAQRSKVRLGFLLCAAAFALALLSMGIHGTESIAASSSGELSRSYAPQLQLATAIAEIIVHSLLAVGLVCLYLVPRGDRWRTASTLLLAIVGADIAVLCYRWIGSDLATLSVVGLLAVLLWWMEMWLIAVLGAEAAEAIERPDITYQTEISGRYILWGGAAWLAHVVWTFDPNQLAHPAPEARGDDFAIALDLVWMVMLLVTAGRTALFCGGLAAALSTADR